MSAHGWSTLRLWMLSAPFTPLPFPCGALEVFSVVDKLSRDVTALLPDWLISSFCAWLFLSVAPWQSLAWVVSFDRQGLLSVA